jgi:hypothetical protein
MVFVSSTQVLGKALVPPRTLSPSQIYSTVPLDDESWLASSFFSTFLSANNITGSTLDIRPVSLAYQLYPSLRKSVNAIALIDSSKKPCSYSSLSKTFGKFEALRAYQAAMLDLQKELANPSMLSGDGCLWTTLFLGLFEVNKSILCTEYI